MQELDVKNHAEVSADSEAVREHLTNVLASKSFAGSPRLQNFLSYVVERTLAGEGGQIKEYVVATEVYARSVDYDPQIDSTVRVEASRLRSKLREYYEKNGDGPIRIELPKGSYVPVFQTRVVESTELAAESAEVPKPLNVSRYLPVCMAIIAVVLV